MSVISELRHTVDAMAAGARLSSRDSLGARSLQQARQALILCEVVCGGWTKIPHHEDLEWSEDIDRPSWQDPSDEEWDGSVVEMSRVDSSFVRITFAEVAGRPQRQWIVERSFDGGYGDDGMSGRWSADLRLEGRR